MFCELHFRGVRALCGGLIGLVAASVVLPAHADLGGPITVTLSAPGGVIGDSTPVLLSDTVSAGPGIEITAGDGSAIGGFMLTTGAGLQELIDFSGNSILVRVDSGARDANDLPVTGYLGLGADAASYTLDGLNITGQRIVGLALGASDGFAFAGFSGVASPALPSSYIRLAAPDRIVFDLDTLVFVDRGHGDSNNYAEFRIDLVTVPVPEPASTTLMAAGLLALWRVRRRRHTGHDAG